MATVLSAFNANREYKKATVDALNRIDEEKKREQAQKLPQTKKQ